MLNNGKKEEKNTDEKKTEDDAPSSDAYVNQLKNRVKKLEEEVEYWQEMHKKIQEEYLSHTRDISMNLCRTIDHLILIIEEHVKDKVDKSDKKTMKDYCRMYRM